MKDMSFKEYITDFWNINDILPPIIIIMIAVLTLAGVLSDLMHRPNALTFFSVAMSIAVLCLWFKIMHFLRIFESTNFLVRAIFSCITNVFVFLCIFLVILLGVGSA